MFLTFKVIFRRLMANLSIPFVFYRDNCLDWVVVLFSSWICVCECPVGVNCLRKTLFSADFFFNVYKSVFCEFVCMHECSYPCNLRSFLLQCGTRPNEWGTQWDSNSLVKVCQSSLLTITPPEVPLFISMYMYILLFCFCYFCYYSSPTK